MNKIALLSRDQKTDPDGGPAATNGNFRYWAFLSYSHQDAKIADWLHKALERFAIPKPLVGRVTANGAVPPSLAPIFRDRSELAASSDLGETIRAALQRSRFLIVLCSPAAAASRWVNEEILAFKKLHGDGRVLAAIVGGEPFADDIPGREAEECFPPALRQKVDRRGRPTGERAEPIAADLREEGDGREAGKLKLIAGMLGLGLDDLVRREQQRRQHRWRLVATASVAGMIFTSGLSLVAIQSRDAARDERREAEGLVEFMLGDLRDELEPIGELDSLDKVGARALAYYSRQKEKNLTDDQLAQRSRALTLLGQIATSRGDSDAAEAYYREAFRGTQELVLRAPNDPQRLYDHAQNVFYIGEMARDRGRMERAERAYREYDRLADRMVASEPSNNRWQMEKVYAQENVGIALLNRRRFAEAASQFETSLGPMSAMASTYPNNFEYQKELSTVLAWLADARRDEGRLQEATALRERQIAFLTRLRASGNTNVRLREHLVWAQQALGILLMWQGQSERGIERLRSAVATAESLIPVEPDNAIWKSSAAGARLELARSLIWLGRYSQAAKENEAGCALTAGLRDLDTKTARWLSFQTMCRANRSRLALASGSPVEALLLAERALESARTERSVDAVKDRYSIAAAYRLIGDIRRRMGDRTAAREAWTAGLEQLPANVPERPREMAERADLLDRLNRKEEALPLIAKLLKTGYRRAI